MSSRLPPFSGQQNYQHDWPPPPQGSGHPSAYAPYPSTAPAPSHPHPPPVGYAPYQQPPPPRFTSNYEAGVYAGQQAGLPPFSPSNGWQDSVEPLDVKPPSTLPEHHHDPGVSGGQSVSAPRLLRTTAAASSSRVVSGGGAGARGAPLSAASQQADSDAEGSTAASQQQQPLPPRPTGGKAATQGPSDFVKKLFKMLEDTSYANVVGWSASGKSFIVWDMNGFTSHVLPATFRHSNFASFVRQLNKYDFHKVKSNEEGSATGENVWEFKHPRFTTSSKNSLEFVKRKPPTGKKTAPPLTTSELLAGGGVGTGNSVAARGVAGGGMVGSDDESASPSSQQNAMGGQHHLSQGGGGAGPQIDPVAFYELQSQVAVLQHGHTTMFQHVQTLHSKYQKIISDLITLQRSNTSTEALVGDVVNYLVKMENEQQRGGGGGGGPVDASGSGGGGFTPSSSAGGTPGAGGPGQGGSTPGAGDASAAKNPPFQSHLASSSQVGPPSQQPNQQTQQQDMQADPTLNTGGVPRPSLLRTATAGAQQESRQQQQQQMSGSAPGSEGSTPKGWTAPGVNQQAYQAPGYADDGIHHSPDSQQQRPGSAGNQMQQQSVDGGNATASSSSLQSHAIARNSNPFGNTPALYQDQLLSAVGGQGSVFSEGENTSGVRVFTVGHLRPRNEDDHLDGSGGAHHSLRRESYPGFDSVFDGESPWANALASRPSTAVPYGANTNGAASSSTGASTSYRPGSSHGPQGSSGDPVSSFRAQHTNSAPASTTQTPAATVDGASPFGSLDANSQSNPVAASGSSSPTRRPGTLRVRRSTYVPGWAVKPRVLIVEDDAVYQRMSKKYLEVAGCTVDVAVDGLGGVNAMELEHYDLVLMDIVLPNLSGTEATSLIRQFDPKTPIISMTANSKPEDLLSYMSSGMSGHLPKPFSKDALMDMLQKHLIHMTSADHISSIPRAPLPSSTSDAEGAAPDLFVQQALAHGAVALQNVNLLTESEDGVNGASSSGGVGGSSNQGLVGGVGGANTMVGLGGFVNSLSAVGVNDETYMTMLHSLLSGSGMNPTLFEGALSPVAHPTLKRSLSSDDDPTKGELTGEGGPENGGTGDGGSGGGAASGAAEIESSGRPSEKRPRRFEEVA